ncbi:MAG TPA: DinB family protein [Candidatus Limnocylindrales bacterium]|nr:DinB family protein [Candidatus Limnocylindrales bacterium]
MNSALDIEAIAGLLRATVTTVTDELRSLGREAGWRPAAGEWSANECVGHLIEADQRGFGGRIRMILAGDLRSPVSLQTWDPPGVAAARADHQRDPASLIAEFDTLRRDGVDLVRSLRPEDLTRSGTHPEVGVLRVDELLAEWVHHDRNHVRQMLAVTQARIWDQMGNAQRFSLLETD